MELKSPSLSQVAIALSIVAIIIALTLPLLVSNTKSSGSTELSTSKKSAGVIAHPSFLHKTPVTHSPEPPSMSAPAQRSTPAVAHQPQPHAQSSQPRMQHLIQDPNYMRNLAAMDSTGIKVGFSAGEIRDSVIMDRSKRDYNPSVIDNDVDTI